MADDQEKTEVFFYFKRDERVHLFFASCSDTKEKSLQDFCELFLGDING